MNSTNSNSEIEKWESIYANGDQVNEYPFDYVVSTVKRLTANHEVEVGKFLELGCGTGANLMFAAKEGWQTTGIEMSSSAIEICKELFERQGIDGEWICLNFSDLNLDFEKYSFALDRAAVTHVHPSLALTTWDQVWHSLIPGGFMLTQVFEVNSDSNLGVTDPNYSMSRETGHLANHPPVCFYSEETLWNWLGDKWELVFMDNVQTQRKNGDTESTRLAWIWCLVRKPFITIA